jgi:hypothetical protein
MEFWIWFLLEKISGFKSPSRTLAVIAVEEKTKMTTWVSPVDNKLVNNLYEPERRTKNQEALLPTYHIFISRLKNAFLLLQKMLFMQLFYFFYLFRYIFVPPLSTRNAKMKPRIWATSTPSPTPTGASSSPDWNILYSKIPMHKSLSQSGQVSWHTPSSIWNIHRDIHLLAWLMVV